MDTDTTKKRVIGYLRVSTGRQEASGAGLAAQESAVRGECERRGWELVRIAADPAVSGKSMKNRPQFAAALADLDAGTADVLMAHKVSRVSRSQLDFAELMARSARKGWAVVLLDAMVDTSTPNGKLMVSIMAAFAECERELIAERTRDALAEKRAAGVRLGRPTVLSADVRAMIRAERASGATLAAIAARLNAEHVPTAHGGAKWHPATVRRVALSVAA